MKKLVSVFSCTLLVLALSTLLCTSTLLAQVSTCQIEGKIVDNQNQPVPMAEVLLKSAGTGLVRGTTTTDKGAYHFYGLPPGGYSVTVRHIGFHPQTRDLDVLLGQTVAVNFTISPREVQMGQVEVIGYASVHEIKKADVSAPVTNMQIQSLPLDARSILTLASVAPGIRSFSAVGGQSLPGAGAVSAYNFLNLYVDGADWKSHFNGNIVGLGQTASPIAQEAIQEFRVVLNAYDPEYTRGGAYVISAVTKRGTNELRGTVFGTMQTQDLTTRGPFQIVKPNYNRQQTGVSLTGPVIEGKLFFAATYELSNANNYLDVIPGRPSYNPELWSQYKGSFQSPRVTHNGAFKLTYQSDEKNTFDLSWDTRYTWSKFYFGGAVAYQAGLFGEYRVNNVMLKNTHFFSERMMNEFTLQYLRWRHDEPTITGGASLIYPAISLGRGDFPIRLAEDHFKIMDKFTYFLDNHVIKAGFEFLNLTAKPWFPYYKDGQFWFATDTSKLPYRAMVGIGINDPNSTADAEGNTTGYSIGGFIQDKWDVSERLTVNLGFRLDAEIDMLNNKYTVPWVNDPDIVAKVPSVYLNRGDRTNQFGISPRISLTYDLFGDALTSLRAGYGLFYDRNLGQLGYFEQAYATWRQYDIQNPGTMDVSALRSRILAGTAGVAIPTLYLVSKDMKLPKIDQWSIGISRLMNDNLSIGVDYINKHYSQIYKAYDANYLQPSKKARILTPKFASIWLYSSFGEAWYQAVLTSINFKTQDFTAQLSYTLAWSDALNDGTTWTMLSSFVRQRSTTDERHRIVLNGSVELPFGFQASSIITLASPSPYTVYDGRDLNDDNATGDDWPNGERNRVPSYNSIRNWYKMLDLRITKTLTLGQYRIALMFDTFNLGNWFNISGFNGRMYDQSGNPYASYGAFTGAYQPRTMQFGARVSF